MLGTEDITFAKLIFHLYTLSHLKEHDDNFTSHARGEKKGSAVIKKKGEKFTSAIDIAYIHVCVYIHTYIHTVPIIY